MAFASSGNARKLVSFSVMNTRWYTFEALALPYLQSKRLKRVLTEFSPTFPGFYLYYPSRKQQPAKLKAFVDYALTRFSQSSLA